MFRKTDIPETFHSDFTEEPFARCIDCEQELLHSDAVYTVIKHYVAKEAVFEMAICLSCSNKLRESYSEESIANIMQFIDANTKTPANHGAEPDAGIFVSEQEPSDIDWQKALRHCVFCQKSQAECHRYEIIGGFLENQLILQPGLAGSLGSPMMMCDDCNAAMSELLSKATRDSWDRFVEDHFDGPPGIEEDSPHREPILI